MIASKQLGWHVTFILKLAPEAQKKTEGVNAKQVQVNEGDEIKKLNNVER